MGSLWYRRIFIGSLGSKLRLVCTVSLLFCGISLEISHCSIVYRVLGCRLHLNSLVNWKRNRKLVTKSNLHGVTLQLEVSHLS